MIDYKKYRWFFTSSGNLVVGGKSAPQNDVLMKHVTRSDKDYVVMHTSEPGSPFCVIISEPKAVTKQDLQEAAIFTGCFSKAWKHMKKKARIDMFRSMQVFKEKNMKSGTWGVSGIVKKVAVPLQLVLTKQKNVYRAVPELTTAKREILLKICPGKIDKEKMIDRLLEKLGEMNDKKDELLAALPAGGVKVCL